MSDIYIRGDGEYASVPVVDAGNPPDYSVVQMTPISVEFGTSSDPIRIWQSGTAFIDAYHYIDTQGYHHYNISWNTLSGWSGANTNPQSPNINGIGNVDTLYIGACKQYDDEGIVCWSVSGSFPNSNGILYYGDWSNLEDQTSPLEDWDETPSANEDDPTNLEAIGGEFADRGFFDQTDNIGLDEIETPEELDYGNLVTPYVLVQDLNSPNLSDLNQALFLAGFWTNLKNKFEGLSDPLSMILDAIELPYTPGSSYRDIKLGGVALENASGNPIRAGALSTRYEKKTIGTINLKEVWGTEKDYNQCSIQIYLPFVGMRDIDTDLAVNNTLTLVALIDRWNGDILYLLHCSNTNSRYKYFSSEFIAYRWNGNCAKKVPLGRVDTTNAVLSLLSGIKNGMMVTAMTGNIVGGIASTGASMLTSNFNPTVQSSGNLAGSVGRMDLSQAYLVIKRSVPSYPNNWRSEMGATRYQELAIQDIAGYTEFAEIHADDITGATDDEKIEIENILKSGVFIN